MGSGQGQRGRCAGGRATSRMALCGSTKSAPARCNPGTKRTAYRAAADCDSGTDWADFEQQRLADQQKQQALANQIAATRIWTINRKTGDVSYMLNGRGFRHRPRAPCDRTQPGRRAIVFGWRWPSRNTDRGSHVLEAKSGSGWLPGARFRHGIFAQFTDPECKAPSTRNNSWRILSNSELATAFHRNQAQN